MSVTERVWNALVSMIKLEDKISQQLEIIKAQQSKIENLTARVLELEAAKIQQSKLETLTERVIKLEATLETLFRVSNQKRLK